MILRARNGWRVTRASMVVKVVAVIAVIAERDQKQLGASHSNKS